jgi:hypothetical protein
MANDGKTIAYRIEIDKDAWEKFKATTPKSISTMNERICRLIYDVIGEPYPSDSQSNKKPKKK